MELEDELAALGSRIDRMERDLGQRVAVLERRIDDAATLPMSTRSAPPPPPRSQTQPGDVGTTPPPPPGGRVPIPAAPTPPVQLPPAPVGVGGPSQPPSPYEVLTGQQPPPPAPGSGPTGALSRSPSFEVSVEVILRWAGIALVVLSAVFLVSTAISRGWIGPELQLLGATIGGLGLLGGALHLLERRREFALALGNGGAAVVVTCAGAAYGWLELLPAGPALLLVTAAAVLVVAVAHLLSMESVAVTGAAALFIVPTVAEILADAPVLATGVWLGAAAMAATAFGLFRGWALFRIASVTATSLWVFGLAAILADDNNTEHAVAGTLLVVVIGLVMWLNPILARRFADRFADHGSAAAEVRRPLAGLEHRANLLLPLWTWAAISLFNGLESGAQAGWFGLLLAAGFALVALAAGAATQWITEVELTSQLLGAGLLITIATVSWLGGPTLMVVVAGQALATLIISGFFTDLWLRVQSYLLGLLALAMLAVALLNGIDVVPTVSEHLAYGLVVAALSAMAWLIGRREPAAFVAAANGAVWLAGVGYACSVAARFVDDQEWLFVGVAVFVAGAAVSRRLGPYVLATTLAIGGATVFGAMASILDAAGSGVPVIVHLANLSVVVALGLITAGTWFVVDRVDLGRGLLVVSWLFALGWIASVLLHVPQGQVAVTGAWAIAACIALVAGVRTGDAVVRGLGLATLGVVLTKLLTVDLAEVETLWRVGLFLVVGLGLLRLGYVLPNLAERYGPKDDGGTGGIGQPAGATGATGGVNETTS